jgi:hypothetical protein
MSSELPVRPNLEHLKKQARQRLRRLQLHEPGAQLADAQHAVAREYGFASWPKLKAHVDALTSTGERTQPPAGTPQPPPGHTGGSSSPDYSFERYSERAKRATFFSRWEASQLGSPTIECEHLLLGVVHARQDLAGLRPSRFAPPIAEVRSTVAGGSVVLPALPGTVMVPFSEATKIALARAAEAANSLGHHQITTGHLLLALMQSAPSMTARILLQYDVSERLLMDDADVLLTDG